MNESDLPPLYRAADAAAKRAQSHFLLALAGNLTFIVVAAILSAMNIQTREFAAVQLVPLLVTLTLTVYLAWRQPQRIWYGTRALAESVKTVAWRYAMRAEPFDQGDVVDRRQFADSLRKIFDANRDVSKHAVEMEGGSQLTTTLIDVRQLSLKDRISLYESGRIVDQHAWYSAKARSNRKSSRNWFIALIGLNGIALLFAIGKVGYPSINFWPTDVLVASAGVVMAWLQTKRFQELAASYKLTADEISLLSVDLSSDMTEREFSIFVGDAENAFSREHTQWQARRDAD